MSTYNQFYAGADPSYLPPTPPGKKPGSRSLAGPIMATLIVAMAFSAVVVRLLSPSPTPDPRVVVVSDQKVTRPAVRLTSATPDTQVRRGGRRIENAPDDRSEATDFQGRPLLLPTSPQTRAIILDNPPLLPPFPTEHNIRVGTPRAHLVRSYGKPDLSARTVQQERLVETYVYEQKDRATFVQIQDGKVISAYTGQPEKLRVLPSEPEPDN